MPDVVLYTRAGCHLCDVAQETLARYGLVPRLVDIDHDPQALAEYDHWVPVVAIDGQVRFRGQIDEVLLRRLLLASGARSEDNPARDASVQRDRK